MSLHTLMFGWEFPPFHSGGLGIACAGLVRGLAAGGTRVTLVLPQDPGNAGHGVSVRFPTEQLPCRLIRVESPLQPYEGRADFAARGATRIPGAIASEELYGPDLGEAVERFTEQSVAMTEDLSPDMVHCHDWMTFGAGMCAAAHHETPLVAHIHATEMDRTNGNPDQWIYDRERAGLTAADKVIAVSGFTKNMLVRDYGIPAQKIAVVHNAHDRREVSHTPVVVSRTGKTRSPLVLFLGRLTLQKNPVQFLEVAKRVHDLRPDVRFVMAGDGPMLGELVARSCAMGLADSVVFSGKVSRREAMSLYAGADCFVMPSLSEPFGLVALEAVAHGVPVILSKQSGVSEVVDHAFKVDFWDTDKMADCIVTVLREQPLARQLRSEAPRLLRTLTWKNQAAAVASVYRSLLHPR